MAGSGWPDFGGSLKVDAAEAEQPPYRQRRLFQETPGPSGVGVSSQSQFTLTAMPQSQITLTLLAVIEKSRFRRTSSQ